MYIESKKIVILCIFVFIMYVSTVIYYQSLINENIDILIFSSESDSRSEGYDQMITDELNEGINYLGNTASNYNVSTITSRDVSEANLLLEREVYGNDLIFIVGDSYNENLEEVIKKNPETYFVLVDDENLEFSIDHKVENWCKININKNEIITQTANELSKATDSNKYLYIDVLSNDNLDEEFQLFSNEIIKENEKNTVKSFYIDDKASLLQIQEQLENDYNEGYTSVYINCLDYTTDILDVSLEYQENKTSDYLQVQKEIDEVTELIEKLDKEAVDYEESLMELNATQNELLETQSQIKFLTIITQSTYLYEREYTDFEGLKQNIVYGEVSYNFKENLIEIYSSMVNNEKLSDSELTEKNGITYTLLSDSR